MSDVNPPPDNGPLTKTSDSKVKNIKAIQQESNFDVSSEKEMHPGLRNLIEKDARWTNGIKLMKDYGASEPETWRVMDAFSSPPDAGLSTSEVKAQRWYGGDAKKIGPWVTTDKYKTGEEAKKYLNFPDKNKADQPPADLIIEKGTPTLTGKAKGNDANQGGGNQIYILDPSKIHEA